MKIYDKDLDFLNDLNDEELKGLYNIIVYGNEKDVEKDNKRFNENLSSSLKSNKYKDILNPMVEELKKYGGHSFVNVLRGGKGVEYKEILLDVCKKFKVKPPKYRSVVDIERELIEQIIERTISKMSAEEIEELVKIADIKIDKNLPLSQAATTAFIYIFKAGGFKSYQLTVIIANAILKFLIGRGLTFGGNVLLVRLMSILTGPIGWVLTGIWTAADVAGPAYRVTIPAVIEIIMLRNMHEANLVDSKWTKSIFNE